jgi:uncharacterized damage-inducible protein DinB
MAEASRIADQLRRAFEGEAWHGDSLLELLAGVTAAKAAAHPVKGAHSIWELVLHITAWDGAVNRRIVSGKALTLRDEENFPPVTDSSEDAWKHALTNLEKVHEELIQTALNLPDSRLHERVAGKDYDIYFMLHGVTQHELYHAGQIAILKKG